MKTGKLIIFRGPGELMEMQSRNVCVLNPGEILVRNQFTTICGSDIHTYSGLRNEPCPIVLGHEIVGSIAEISEEHSGLDFLGGKIKLGDSITWSIFSSDPTSCCSLEGIPQKGEGLFKYGHALVTEDEAFHGGLAEYCILKPNTSILKVPADLPLPIAATINCAISTVAGALRLAGNVRNKNIFISGMGMLGITCAAMCKDAGANWVGAADISDKRLDNSLKFGADEIFNISDDGSAVSEKIRTKFSKKGVDVVFDMSGSPDAMESSLNMLAVGGKAIWVGAVFNTRKVKIDPENVIRNLITIKGLHNYNFEDFVYALDFIKRNWERYPFESVVEKEFDLADAQMAFEYALQHKPLRVGVRMEKAK